MGQAQFQQAKVHQLLQAPILRCDFCGEGHANGECIPEGVSEEANYTGNYQKGNPYSNTYISAWAQHPNLKYQITTP